MVTIGQDGLTILIECNRAQLITLDHIAQVYQGTDFLLFEVGTQIATKGIHQAGNLADIGQRASAEGLFLQGPDDLLLVALAVKVTTRQAVATLGIAGTGQRQRVVTI